MDILRLRERVSDANMPKFLEELNHQLSLTGLLREARELVCRTVELADRQRTLFAQQTLGMLQMDEPARDVREVIARAVVGMSERDVAGFEHEVIHMLNGSLHKPASPYREALSCAAYAARFPEHQQAELRRQLKGTPLAAFRAQQQPPQAASRGGGGQQPRFHNLPPLREWEKLADPRRAAGAPAGPRLHTDPVRPANYSLREFPIFPSH
ncbi:hypothetical protein UCDDA912_g01179 [Diaporthe ampelina]|uniref:Uncharacterized protein n=1 Tax=Diaporthe ampelina TaxID=1214573 RepID=A0A0G2FX99_9PEZI|nr:hypothetical protein UCDDA912_g01179 [Diaporthe ampelina]